MNPLRREGLFGPLLSKEVLALGVLALNHVNDVLEPLAEQDGVLSTAWLAQIAISKAHFGSLFLDGCLEPHWLLFLLRPDTWLGQLVSQIVQRLEELASIWATACTVTIRVAVDGILDLIERFGHEATICRSICSWSLLV